MPPTPLSPRANPTAPWTPIEQERAAIARELHDGLASLLAAVRFDLAWIESQPGRPGVSTRARCAADTLRQAQETLRHLTRDLRPPELQAGLGRALRQLCAGFEGRYAIAVDLRLDDGIDADAIEIDPARAVAAAAADGVGAGTRSLAMRGTAHPPPLAPALALAAYRFAQEGLANAARHAGCHGVQLSASAAAGHLTLELRDDGRGFDPTAFDTSNSASSDSTGLRGLRERAASLGGWLDIASRPGAGSTLVLCLPLEAHA